MRVGRLIPSFLALDGGVSVEERGRGENGVQIMSQVLPATTVAFLVHCALAVGD